MSLRSKSAAVAVGAAIAAGAAALLMGCLPESFTGQNIGQSRVCVANSDQQAMQCPEGKLFLARLNHQSAEQRAFGTLNTVALYCDTNHQVVHNSAGVLCVMTHERLSGLAEAPLIEEQPRDADAPEGR